MTGGTITIQYYTIVLLTAVLEEVTAAQCFGRAGPGVLRHHGALSVTAWPGLAWAAQRSLASSLLRKAAPP